MLSAGMPELKEAKNLENLVKPLHLSKSDQEASKFFKKKIMDALGNKMRRIDNLAHNWKQM